MALTHKQVEKMRDEAFAEAFEQMDKIDDPDALLALEADIFEAKLGNYLIANRKFFAKFRKDEGWREDLEDLIGVDWDEFLDNVAKCMV